MIGIFYKVKARQKPLYIAMIFIGIRHMHIRAYDNFVKIG